MDFIVITGPQAVGKMAVGKAISEKTGLRLFHNHMTIELVISLFPYNSQEGQTLIKDFRQSIFEKMASSDQAGMIFTYVWAFDLPSEYDYIYKQIELFEARGATTYIVELESDLETRLERNKTPLRLQEKPSKRNLEWSDKDVRNGMKKYRLNSLPGEITHANYLRLDNSQLTVDEAADKIIDYFSLKRL